MTYLKRLIIKGIFIVIIEILDDYRIAGWQNTTYKIGFIILYNYRFLFKAIDPVGVNAWKLRFATIRDHQALTQQQ